MVAQTLRGLNKYDALLVAGLVWFHGKFVRYVFPPLFETLGASYGVSTTILGLAFSGFLFVYAILQFPSGLLADRFGFVRVITAGAILTTAGTLALVVDLPFVILAISICLMGAGTGVYKTVSVGLLARAYPERSGRVLGIFDTFGTFGGVAAPASVVVVLTLPPVFGAPWRTLFLGAGIAGILFTIAFATRVPARLRQIREASDEGDEHSGRDSEVSSEPSEDTHVPLHRRYLLLFRKPQFAGFTLVTILFTFGYNGAITFLPLYLINETALSSVIANLLFSVYFVVSFVQIITGDMSDRVGTVPVILLMLTIATAGLVAILAFSDTGGPLILGGAVILLGLGAHGFRPVRAIYVTELAPKDVTGGSLGIVRTMLMMSNALSPAIVGYVSEVAGFRLAFGLLALTLVLGTALMLGLWFIDR